MKDILLSKRYAKAIFDIAIEKDAVEMVKADLDIIASVFAENAELRQIIANPFVSNERKLSIFKSLFGESVSPMTIDFLAIIIEKKREDQIQYIAEQYADMYLDYKNIAIVKITSAVELDDQTLNRIAKKMADKTTKQIQVVNVIDKKIIGGFIINMDDYQYDASVQNVMHQLRRSFDENLFVKGY